MTGTIKRVIRRSLVNQVAGRAKEEKKDDSSRIYVPTGSTLLNLALSDKVDGGFLTGKLGNIVGDRSAGKTFLALTVLATCAYIPAFDNYLLIHDDSEEADEFNTVKLFGQKAANRILPPSLNRDDPKNSHTIMDFQCNVRRLLKGDKPIIYIQDSLDSLKTKEELEHAEDLQKAHESGKEAKGTYGMEKAKQIGILLRLILSDLKNTESLVLIISQTRDNIDPMSFQKRTRSGGKALYFYCSYEMWLAVARQLNTNINNKPRNIGVISRIKGTKNKSSGKSREIDVPIFYDYGLDDIGSCIDFLISEGWWESSKSGMITAKEFDIICQRTKLINTIEEKNLIGKLQRVTAACWMDIETRLKIDRKPKFPTKQEEIDNEAKEKEEVLDEGEGDK